MPEPLTTLPSLLTGVYRHYKGQHYQPLGYGHDANEPTRAVVLYVPLELDGAHYGPRLAVRTALDNGTENCDPWWDHVCAERRDYGGHGDAALCGFARGASPAVHAGHEPLRLCPVHGNGRSRPRFEYVGPTWEGS